MTKSPLARCTVRAMTESDWPAVQAGFMHSFVTHRPPQVWAWRYQWHQPHQAGWRGWISQAPDGTVAAFFGATVHRCWVQGQEQPLLIARDNYSHPLWRHHSGASRQGLFVSTEQAFHAAGAQEALLCTGIGLDRRARLSTLLNVCTPYHKGHWWRQSLPTPSPQEHGYAIQVLPTQFAEPTWNTLWAQYRQGLRISLVRDREFLAWRFDDRQGQPYWRFALWSITSAAPVGFVVLTPTEPGRAILVDLVLPQAPQAVRDAWLQITRWLRDRGISHLDTFIGQACPAHPWLPLLGFTPVAPPLPVQPVYRCYTPLDFDNDYPFTLADSDLY